MKEYLCLDCIELFEYGAESVCPKCKGRDVIVMARRENPLDEGRTEINDKH